MTYSEFKVENWEELAKRYKKERDAARKEARVLAKQYSELATRVAKESAEKPCFAILKP
jgi:hypothetical protein